MSGIFNRTLRSSGKEKGRLWRGGNAFCCIQLLRLLQKSSRFNWCKSRSRSLGLDWASNPPIWDPVTCAEDPTCLHRHARNP